MLTQLGVEFENNELIIPIVGATPKDSLLVRSILGLDPPDINLFIGDYSRDGGTYQGRRVGNRNVVLTIDLNPNPALGETISGLREMLYKIFVDPLVDADYVKVKLYDSQDRVRYVVGYAEKFETSIFSVETTVQISLICPDPYIRDETIITYENDPGWNLVPFTYSGTAETGFDVTIRISSSTSTLTLENNAVTDDPGSPTYSKGRMILNKEFAMGDVVRIITIRGERAITLTPSGGSPSSIIASLTPSSRWLEIHSQANAMKVYGANPSLPVAAITHLQFTQSYWGI